MYASRDNNNLVSIVYCVYVISPLLLLLLPILCTDLGVGLGLQYGETKESEIKTTDAVTDANI